MEDDGKKRHRLRSFVIGGVIGASAVVATGRKRRRSRRRQTPAGLAAFESAPCYRELLESERADGP